jgi:DNA-binding Lrp family transcriptional regulator
MSAVLRQLDLLSDPAAAAACLDPFRRRLLGLLSAPGSATALAKEVDLPRQKVNYHLREMQRLGLVREVGTKQRRGCVERLVQATASHYVVSPEVFGTLSPDPASIKDRFSWAYLVALAARAIRELSVLRQRADSVRQPLPTFSMSVDIRFKDQQALHAFSEELTNHIAALSAKHHDERAEDGRFFRFFLGAHPAVTKSEGEARAEAAAATPAGNNHDALKEAYE